MNEKIKALREKLTKLSRQAVEFLEGIEARDGLMTSEEREKYDKMAADMRSMGETLEALETEEKRSLELAAAANHPPTGKPAGQQRQAAPPAATGGTVMDAVGPFRNFGEFVYAIRHNVREKLAELRELSMGVGEEGGYLVPDQWSQDILMVDPESEVVMPYATVIPAGGDMPDATVHFPALTQGSDGELGGLTFTWIAEGGTKAATDYDLEDVSLEPKEYACHVVVTDKLLRNSAAAAAFLRRMLNEGIAYYRDMALLKGNGVGQPKGVLVSDCALTVARNTASTVKFADVVGMLAKMLPGSWGRAKWIAGIQTLPQIVALQDANGNSIYIAGDVTKGIAPTLLGMPIRWTGRSYALGTQGDLALCDLSYYLVKQGSGPFIEASPHVYFTTNKTVVKAFGNIDGQCWMSAALTLPDASSQVSPVVVLA